MILDPQFYSNEDHKAMFIKGLDFAMYDAYKAKIKYDAYNSLIPEDITVEDTKMYNVLTLLSSLGFSFEQLGTYLYKDLIIYVMDYLENSDINVNEFEVLSNDLKNAYSNTYLIAKEFSEIGTKTFHDFIQYAVSVINEDDINKDIEDKILDTKITSSNYGPQTLNIVSYLLNTNCNCKIHDMNFESISNKRSRTQ